MINKSDRKDEKAGKMESMPMYSVHKTKMTKKKIHLGQRSTVTSQGP